ncbi:hypothetical protein Ae201684P_014538 [Aphanomyces euteiches]|nr:hypothetical protein Ae201684P_014538 [Aphanomyces euteiches]
MDDFFAELTKFRRHLHANPELSFQEYKTQALVRDYLIHQAHIPAEQISVSGKTGLVVDIFGPKEGPLPAEAVVKCVAFRGDMDALPMTEHNSHLEYESKVPGAAHMCGHDGHTVNLMGFGHLVQQRRHLLPPHSTTAACLASMKFHNSPSPLGTVRVKAGPMMAHGGTFTITISVPGGHGSAPHLTKDPIVAAGQVILAINSITSRNVSPHDAAIVSICQVHGGEADNVIPSSVKLSGTIRDFAPAVESTIKQRMATIEHTCAAYGLDGKLRFFDMYPVVVNPERETKIFEAIAASVVGADRVSDEGLPAMAGEDFTYFLQQRPGCFFTIGTREANETQMRQPHSDTFDFNDRILPLSARMYLEIAHERLQCALYTKDELDDMTADVLAQRHP